jgi:hypothetical protein
MSEAKFTPAPWQFADGDSFEKEAVVTTSSRIDNNTIPICEMDVYFDGDVGIEQTANVCLIACAPEMYAMLENVLMTLADINAYDEVNKIEALLAKARGEA